MQKIVEKLLKEEKNIKNCRKMQKIMEKLLWKIIKNCGKIFVKNY